jgi:RNA-binding protein
MSKLTGKQRKFLRGEAHSLSPVVQIGQNGLTDNVIESINTALEARELIKIKFVDFKDEKKEISKEIEEKTKAEVVGTIGHIIILFRQSKNSKNQKIDLDGIL